VEAAHGAVLAAHQEQRPAREGLGERVARARQLALVGEQQPLAPEDALALELEVNVSDSPYAAWLAFSPALLKTLHPEPLPEPAASPCEPASELPSEVRPPKGLDLLLDIDLPVSVSFGRAQLPLKDVLKLTTGAIVELNRTINDPVEVIVNNRIIARGEVVVIEGNYGVRIHEIVSRESRMGSLR